MNTVELKSDLFQLIRETNDPSVLRKIKDIFYSIKEQAAVPVLCEEERKLMEQGLEEIRKGNVFSNDAVRKEINEWIDERR